MDAKTDRPDGATVAKEIGRGWFGSLRKRVDADLREHNATNLRLRRMGYPWLLRCVRVVLVDRPISSFLALYTLLNAAIALAEVAVLAYAPSVGYFWSNEGMKGLLKDSAGFLISAQVGILGVVSVAVGLVTLIGQRNNGSDVELYYVESMAYEVTRSGVALLAVLVIQVSWPLQLLVHLLGYGSQSLAFKVFLTGFHVMWLAINIVTFGHFIVSSLKFVQLTERSAMRERWTVRVILPLTLTRSLLGLYCQIAADRLTVKKSDSEEHRFVIGHQPLSQGGQEELRTEFNKRSILQDVWMVPLEWALASFRKRSTDPSANIDRRQRRRQNDTTLWISPSVDQELEGPVVWGWREGGVLLSRRERWLIRLALRFRRMVPKDDKITTTPATILEELAEEVVAQADARALVGFRRSLDEMVRYHRFLIEIHDSKDDKGNAINLAQVGGFFLAPFQDWSRQYRKPIERTAELIGTDPDFMRRIVRLPYNLMPTNAAPVSAPIVTDLLDMGCLIVALLGQWLIRQLGREIEEGHRKYAMPAIERREYEKTVREFVGGWEDLLKTHRYFYQLEQVADGRTADKWEQLSKTWPFLKRHLRNTAYSVASAVWNEDDFGADHYRDMLLLWLQTARMEPAKDYFLQHEWLILPDRVEAEWPEVERSLAPHRKLDHVLDPEAVFDEVLRFVYVDSVVMAIAAILLWIADYDGQSGIITRTASGLLSRRPLDESATRRRPDFLHPTSDFLSILFAVMRGAIGGRIPDASYGGYLDGLITWMTSVSERPSVPGRVYATFGGWPGRESVQVELLAMMVATIGGDDLSAAVSELDAVASNIDYFADGEASLRSIASELDCLIRNLDDDGTRSRLERCATALRPNVDLATTIPLLRKLLADAKAAVESRKEERLRATPVDPGIMNGLRLRFERELELLARGLHWLKGVRTVRGAGGQETREIIKIVDKGSLTLPQLIGPVLNLEDSLVSVFSSTVAFRGAWHFFQRPKTNQPVNSLDSPEFWKLVQDHAAKTTRPGLIITQAQATGTWNWYGIGDDKPDFVGEIGRIEGRTGSGGNGVAYVMTADGIDIFVGNIPDGHALLFSGDALKSITVTPLANDNLVGVEFGDDGDPHNGWISTTYSVSFEWNDSPMVDFEIRDESVAPPSTAVVDAT